MRTLAKIVVDKNKDVYLKVYNSKVKVLAFFKILCWNDKPNGKITDLSDVFSVDLSGRK